MSALNKVSVIGIIFLLLILYLYMYIKRESISIPMTYQRLLSPFSKVKKGWKLYVDGRLIYTLRDQVLNNASQNHLPDEGLTMGSNSRDQIRIKGLNQNRILLTRTSNQGILVKAYDNTRCIRDLAGNSSTRMLVPYGNSRKMSIAGKKVEFRWFDEVNNHDHNGRG